VADTFALDIRKFAEKAQANAQLVVKKVSQELLTNVVMRTPVGNPDNWQINKIAVQYNAAVGEHNAALRDDPANLDKAGRLRRGKKLNDGMDVVAPKGYVGGRLRANWTVSVGVANRAVWNKVDPSGEATIARGFATIGAADVSKDIYIMNSLPYVRPIEYDGHSKQAPAGMVRVTVTEFQTFVNKAVGELPK
jgi:hypothetical protein